MNNISFFYRHHGENMSLKRDNMPNMRIGILQVLESQYEYCKANGYEQVLETIILNNIVTQIRTMHDLSFLGRLSEVF
jgi:hypothetical protein